MSHDFLQRAAFHSWTNLRRICAVLIALTGLGLVTSAGVPEASAQVSSLYTYMPSGLENDGRFISQAGEDLATLVSVGSEFQVRILGSASTWEVGIFDGDTGKNAAGVVGSGFFHGTWDRHINDQTQLLYSLYADPDGTADTSTDTPLYVWTGNDAIVDRSETVADETTLTYSAADMPDDAWFDIDMPTHASALGSDGIYQYRIRVEFDPDDDGTPGDGLAITDAQSQFKLRATGLLGSASDRPFQFIGSHFRNRDYEIIYPHWFTGATPDEWLADPHYDGSWSLYVFVDEGDDMVEIWDGDFDFGSHDSVDLDTDDPNTVNDLLVHPPFFGETGGYGSGRRRAGYRQPSG